MIILPNTIGRTGPLIPNGQGNFGTITIHDIALTTLSNGSLKIDFIIESNGEIQPFKVDLLLDYITTAPMKIGLAADAHFRPTNRSHLIGWEYLVDSVAAWIHRCNTNNTVFNIDLGDSIDSIIYQPDQLAERINRFTVRNSNYSALVSPIYFCIGNHECKYYPPDGTNDYHSILNHTHKAYDHFYMPYYYYSFDYGPYHFMVINDNEGYKQSSPYYDYYLSREVLNWIHTDLETYHKPTIVILHVPIDDYSPSQYDNVYHDTLLRSLFETDGDIIMVLQAHGHHRDPGPPWKKTINGIPYYALDSMGEQLGYGDEEGNYGYLLTLNPQDKTYSIDDLYTDIEGADWLHESYIQPHASGLQPYQTFFYPDICTGYNTIWISDIPNGQYTVSLHAFGNTSIVTTSWTDIGIGGRYIYKTLQQQQVTYESELSLITLLPGDFNDDCQVNLIDFSILATAYGSSTGDQRYNPECDLDGDGLIDFTDFTIFTSFYGTSC